MEELTGGRRGIDRQGQRVLRPAGFWTPTTQRLLAHLRQAGFRGAPEPMGYAADGREIVSFLPGTVCNYPLSDEARSQEALRSAATLLGAYHDASVSFLNTSDPDIKWRLPAREPQEVVCHGDFAPYNVVLRGTQADGIIDFDTAHPGPRIWDIAYALYRWAPFTNPANHDGFGALVEQIERGRAFCDAYNLNREQRAGLAEQMITRLEALVAFMRTQSNAGDMAFAGNLSDGHHLLYLADIEYLRSNAPKIDAGLAA